MKRFAPNSTQRLDKVLLLACISSVILAGCPQGPGNIPPGNNPPVASAGADRTVTAGASVTLDGSGSSDPDGDAMSFSWKQTLGTEVTLSSESAAIVTFTAPAAGTTLTFELTVSDGQSSSTDTVGVSVQLVEETAEVTEVRQSVPDDPAVTGGAPEGWLVPTVDAPVRPPEEGEIGEFTESYAEHRVMFVPVIEEDLAAGATRTVELPVTAPSGLSGSAQWIGTAGPLDVTLSFDGSTLPTTGDSYDFGGDRGGTLLLAQTTAAGTVTLSVTNTSEATVKVRLALASSAL